MRRLLLAASTDSRAREWRAPVEPPPRRGPSKEGRERLGLRERGVALILSLVTILILTVVLADMHQSTSMSYALADTQEDRLQAEYLARSGINLTRLLVAAEPQIRQAVAIPYAAWMGGRRPPQLPVWSFANEVFRPFCDYERAQAMRDSTGIDFSGADGLGDIGGRCEIVSFSENSKLNLNTGLHLQGDQAKANVALQFFTLTGGLQQPSPYDTLFERRDPDGQITSRLDIVAALVDWWDADQQRTAFDPGTGAITNDAGGEDDIYQSFRDPYRVKNAPFDSLEELRYVRGIGDDFWATFVEPDPDDPTQRAVTVYGSGKVNPNEAMPSVLFVRSCAILQGATTFCTEAERIKFITVLTMLRASPFGQIPWFENHNHWVEFLEGRGQLFTLLAGLFGESMFTPITIPAAQKTQFRGALVFGAAIITVQSTGLVGNCPSDEAVPEEDDEGGGIGRCTRVRIRSVLNFENRWTPPPPNAGAMPALGIFHHWRVD